MLSFEILGFFVHNNSEAEAQRRYAQFVCKKKVRNIIKKTKSKKWRLISISHEFRSGRSLQTLRRKVRRLVRHIVLLFRWYFSPVLEFFYLFVTQIPTQKIQRKSRFLFSLICNKITLLILLL